MAWDARLCTGTGLAPECGTRDGWQGNQSGPSATGSGFPLLTCKRIRAQNSGQGAFILRAAFSLACKAPETGTKAEGALLDLSPSKLHALRGCREPQPHSRSAPGIQPHPGLPEAGAPDPRRDLLTLLGRPEPPTGWPKGFPQGAMACKGVPESWNVMMGGSIRHLFQPPLKCTWGKLSPRERP